MNKIKFLPDIDLETKLTIFAIASFAAGAILYLAIFGLAGLFGDLIGSVMRLFLGRGAFVLPGVFILSGVILVRTQKQKELTADINPRLFWGFFFILASFNGFLSLFLTPQNMNEAETAGGAFGYFIYPFGLGILGPIGAFIILVSIFSVGFFLVSQLSISKFFEILGDLSKEPAKFWDLVPDIFEIWKASAKPQNPEPAVPLANIKPDSTLKQTIFETEKPAPSVNSKPSSDFVLLPNETEKKAEIDAQKLFEKLNPNSDHSEKENGISTGAIFASGETKQNEKIRKDLEKESERAIKKAAIAGLNWELPQFDILKKNTSVPKAEQIEQNKEIIQTTLASFGITVDMQDVNVGPTVTQYTLKPASGVRLSSIDALQRDMALTLAAPNIRIEAPIPGKSLVGVEIPNKNKAMVRLRDLVQTHNFLEFDGDLPVAIGKSVNGTDFLYSLTKMPHLLVAGATGAGKSVWINSLLLSLLYKYLPSELELILVDMKRVELKLYDGIPHLLAPVVTEPEKAINALKWTVIEMDRRYEILEKWGKRNIKDYNQMANSSQGKLEAMPFIVFVIDELGDLMIRAKNEVEPIIARLTQMSRAVGIHLVLGTQRPDTGVITGLIKANVPTRIAFAVASQIDSRVILDVGGAEKLLGQGDGLLISPNHMKPMRFQGCNVEEIEVKKCVIFWRDQALTHGYNNLNPDVLEVPKVELSIPGLSSSNADSEDVYDKAKQLVIQTQKASTSYLQQILGVGYPKAAKLMNQLEAEGVVGPANGVKSRDVYVQEGEERE